ncbi:MAG: 3-deoxy-7-phosphoheptulonate synthase [Chitinophagales bacterium]|nr:MAG: 3-deoxy-7-phosphoheptulonate synthase [Chitinophagales bacterium]
MIIQLKADCTDKQKAAIISKVQAFGYKVNEVTTFERHYLVCVGKADFDIRAIGNLRGVQDVHRVEDANMLVSHQWRVHPTVIRLDDGVEIGRNNLSIIAGPCSIESEEQVQITLDFLQRQHIKLMRGGVFKPRSSPYSFRGLGIEGLKFFSRMARERGIKVVTEVMQVSQIEQMYDYVDVFQVGARNAQNFNLLDELGLVDKPVLLKRGLSTTLEEFLASAEYIFCNGNERIILCERGIRTFEKSYRNTLDLNAVPVLKHKTHLPVIVDPSHGIGIRRFVEPMALAAVMAGADGILVEIHHEPELAYSDGDQTLNFQEAEHLFRKLRTAYALVAQ